MLRGWDGWRVCLFLALLLVMGEGVCCQASLASFLDGVGCWGERLVLCAR